MALGRWRLAPRLSKPIQQGRRRGSYLAERTLEFCAGRRQANDAQIGASRHLPWEPAPRLLVWWTITVNAAIQHGPDRLGTRPTCAPVAAGATNPIRLAQERSTGAPANGARRGEATQTEEIEGRCQKVRGFQQRAPRYSPRGGGASVGPTPITAKIKLGSTWDKRKFAVRSVGRSPET